MRTLILASAKVTSQHLSLAISSYRRKAANANKQLPANLSRLSDGGTPRLHASIASISTVTGSFFGLC